MKESVQPLPSMRTRFKPYPAYKDSGVEWLGEIPAGWQSLKLKRVLSFVYGESLASDVREDGDVAVYGSNGPVGMHTRANTLAPCLVIGRKGSFGKVSFSADAVFVIDTTFVVDRRFTRGDIRWLFYSLINTRLDSVSKDSAIPGLDREDAYAREICLCPPDEQRAIAAFLDRETARIDALVEKKERLIELLQEKRTALITRSVTKGLDPNVPMKDSGVEWLGRVPAHWGLKRLAWIAECLDGKRVPLNAEERGRVHGEYPYWGANSIVDYVDTWIFDEELVLLGEDGAPFFDRDRPVAFRVAGKIWVNNHAHVLRPRNGVDARFLASTLNCVDYRTFINGTTRDKLTQGDMNGVPIQLPPLTEQRRIADYLDRETARIDALVAKVREAIERLKELRTALISAAVTGKIDVRDSSA